jgi:plastocyanin
MIGARRTLAHGVLAAVAALGLATAGTVPRAVAGATTEVAVDDYVFVPERVRVGVGDAVRWVTAPTSESDHNVRENGGIFRSGTPTTSLDYTVTFSSGTFRYFCEPHLGWGMVGVVKVPPTAVAAPSGLPFTVRWATAATDSGTRFDVAYRVGSRPWKTWKAKTAALKAVFGKRGAPVAVRAGTRYAFRVRSRGNGAASAWSPAVSFRP